jgi:hypothetical protein
MGKSAKCLPQCCKYKTTHAPHCCHCACLNDCPPLQACLLAFLSACLWLPWLMQQLDSSVRQAYLPQPQATGAAVGLYRCSISSVAVGVHRSNPSSRRGKRRCCSSGSNMPLLVARQPWPQVEMLGKVNRHQSLSNVALHCLGSCLHHVLMGFARWHMPLAAAYACSRVPLPAVHSRSPMMGLVGVHG